MTYLKVASVNQNVEETPSCAGQPGGRLSPGPTGLLGPSASNVASFGSFNFCLLPSIFTFLGYLRGSFRSGDILKHPGAWSSGLLAVSQAWRLCSSHAQSLETPGPSFPPVEQRRQPDHSQCRAGVVSLCSGSQCPPLAHSVHFTVWLDRDPSLGGADAGGSVWGVNLLRCPLASGWAWLRGWVPGGLGPGLVSVPSRRPWGTGLEHPGAPGASPTYSRCQACPGSTSKLKQPVILPAKWVCREMARELEFRTSKLWQTHRLVWRTQRGSLGGK